MAYALHSPFQRHQSIRSSVTLQIALVVVHLTLLFFCDTMAWEPTPRITLTFSEHADENSAEHDLSLEYSTDATEPNKANKQARSLAQRHLKNIARASEKQAPSKHYAPHEDHSILIKGLGVDTSTLKVDKEKCSVFVRWEDDYAILLNILRLPESSIQRKDADGDMIEVQISTQIDYIEWEKTIGNPDHLPRKVVHTSEILSRVPMFRKRKL